MSVDKFGRYASTGKSKAVRGPKGEGFLLTPDGDYNIQNKRLKLVNNPADELDAVNLKALRQNSISLNSGGVYDAENKRITNVSFPLNGTDSVNLMYLNNQIPIKSFTDKSYSCHQYKIKDVAYPQSGGDAVNVSYVNDKCLLFDKKGVDVKGSTLVHIRDPVDNSDCATKSYVDSRTPYRTKTYWGFGNRRIASVGDPKDLQDSVTVRYMNSNAICKVSNAIKQFDGKGNIITNVAQPMQLDDVVTKRYLKEVVANLGYAMYSNLNKGRAALTPPDQWKAQVLSTSWDDLFK